jgi:hypothetical protein
MIEFTSKSSLFAIRIAPVYGHPNWGYVGCPHTFGTGVSGVSPKIEKNIFSFWIIIYQWLIKIQIDKYKYLRNYDNLQIVKSLGVNEKGYDMYIISYSCDFETTFDSYRETGWATTYLGYPSYPHLVFADGQQIRRMPCAQNMHYTWKITIAGLGVSTGQRLILETDWKFIDIDENGEFLDSFHPYDDNLFPYVNNYAQTSLAQKVRIYVIFPANVTINDTYLVEEYGFNRQVPLPYCLKHYEYNIFGCNRDKDSSWIKQCI